MATPKQGYFLKDGTRIPSVTTILSRFKDSGGLIHWAWKLGTEGQDYRQVRDSAADAGTIAHQMIDDHIHGREFKGSDVTDDILTKATNAFNSYLSWQKTTGVEIIWTERQLVSETHKYGGTPDALGLIDKKPVLIDWKTSNAIYSDYLLQLAAYAELIVENDWEPVTGFYLCRFSKEHGDFSVHHYPDLSDALKMFLLLRQAYEIDKSIKQRTKG